MMRLHLLTQRGAVIFLAAVLYLGFAFVKTGGGAPP